jgi:hypothetical protein
MDNIRLWMLVTATAQALRSLAAWKTRLLQADLSRPDFGREWIERFYY